VFVRVWRFRAAAGREDAFERFNGSAGDWAQLFRKAAGYFGTDLHRADVPGEYITIDRWESRDAWEAFRRDYADAYEALDREGENLTVSETLVREQDENL
jgi:heme-degrading monooxygenase HmoA